MASSLPVSESNKFWARIFLQYDNGGHVSKMLQHVSAAETLGVRCKLRQLFSNPT